MSPVHRCEIFFLNCTTGQARSDIVLGIAVIVLTRKETHVRNLAANGLPGAAGLNGYGTRSETVCANRRGNDDKAENQ
jgi:hypothetical protein